MVEYVVTYQDAICKSSGRFSTPEAAWESAKTRAGSYRCAIAHYGVSKLIKLAPTEKTITVFEETN